jgi:hypothetical protein
MDLTDDPASVIRHPILGGVDEGEDMKPPGAGWMRERKRERRGRASPVILLGLVSPPFLINSIGSLHDGSELSESRRPWGRPWQLLRQTPAGSHRRAQTQTARTASRGAFSKCQVPGLGRGGLRTEDCQ